MVRKEESFIFEFFSVVNKKQVQSKSDYESQGRENTFENYLADSFNDEVVYSFAWKGGLKEHNEDEAIIEWTECPIAAGFIDNGLGGVEIGEMFCEHVDNASIQVFNSKYECVRESSLYKDGLCRLHFKLNE